MLLPHKNCLLEPSSFYRSHYVRRSIRQVLRRASACSCGNKANPFVIGNRSLNCTWLNHLYGKQVPTQMAAAEDEESRAPIPAIKQPKPSTAYMPSAYLPAVTCINGFLSSNCQTRTANDLAHLWIGTTTNTTKAVMQRLFITNELV